MIPGTNGLSVPIRTDIFSVPKIMAEHMYLLMSNNGTEDGRKFRDSMASSLFSSFASPTPIPQAIKPLMEVGINYDFFQQRPIVGQYQQGLETARQFNESTSELGKAIGSTGLIAPLNADHLIRGMFGSVGGLTLYLTNKMMQADSGVERPDESFHDMVAELPGMSGFLSREYETGLKKDYYVLNEEVQKVVKTYSDLKSSSPEQLESYTNNPDVQARLGLKNTVQNIDTKLSKLRKQMVQISNMPESQISSADKEAQIKELQQAEVEMLKDVDIKGLRREANL